MSNFTKALLLALLGICIIAAVRDLDLFLQWIVPALCGFSLGFSLRGVLERP